MPGQTRVNYADQHQPPVAGCEAQDSTVHVSQREDQSAIEKTKKAGLSNISSFSSEAASLAGRALPAEPNYMIKIQSLIAKILAQHVRIADKERVQKESQKKKFTDSNLESGALTKEMGNRGLKFTGLTLGLMASQFLAREGDREFINYLAQHGSRGLLDMLNSKTQSELKREEGSGSINLAELNSLMNKSDPASKQEIINLLEKILDSLKRAAQS